MCVAVFGSLSLTNSNQKPRPFQVLGELIPRFNLPLAKLSAVRGYEGFSMSRY